MTWTIGPITLPMEPKEINKKTTRTQSPVSATGDFPSLTENQVARFELQIKGFIFPRSLAQELDELTRNPDSEDIGISLSEEAADVEHEWLGGFYSVARSQVFRKKPLFTKVNGVDEEVYEYNISFLKFADAGTDQTAVEGGGEEDEPGSGFLDMDADDDGKIDLDGIFEFITSIFTWGASDPS
jgi:hypothetical protein